MRNEIIITLIWFGVLCFYAWLAFDLKKRFKKNV